MCKVCFCARQATNNFHHFFSVYIYHSLLDYVVHTFSSLTHKLLTTSNVRCNENVYKSNFAFGLTLSDELKMFPHEEMFQPTFADLYVYH